MSEQSAPWLIASGIVVTLTGLIGDLVGHTLNPAAHAHEELVSFGRGANPWHFVLFAGIVLTAAGGIRWAARTRGDAARMLGAVMALLLFAAVALGGWAAWEGVTSGAAGIGHVHGATGAGSHAGHIEGGEGGSHFGHGHGVPGPVSPAQRVILNRQLATARRATAKYRNIDVAKADGYIEITQFIPGLGLHMAKLSLLAAGFDPGHPQILLYQPDGKGGMILAGVAYSLPHTSDTPPAGFAGGSDVWHYHTDLCFLPGGSVTITQSGADCRSSHGYFQAQTPWLLHAWIWKTNPRGVFTEYNPRVT